ncbi:MAG: helix-turn-helix domain-containing protein [Planctomycetes bacterium]|nr:helix-turn-helix domain-containing protein [Planctomycetota bacterium]
MKKITQYDLAKQLGLNQATISKILTGYALDTFPEGTKKKVFSAAKKLGYVHPALITPKRRISPRKRLEAMAHVKVVLADGSLFAEFRARLGDVGATGMLLEDLEGEKRYLPIDPFLMEVEVSGPDLAGLRVRGNPVRFERTEDGKLGFAIEMMDLTEEDKVRISAIVAPPLEPRTRKPRIPE